MTKQIKLETAKRLHAICQDKGVTKPRSELYWKEINMVTHTAWELRKYLELDDNLVLPGHRWGKIPAYDTNEILDWLPVLMENEKTKTLERLNVLKYKTSYIAAFGGIYPCQEESPQEALAELLIFLISNDLMK